MTNAYDLDYWKVRTTGNRDENLNNTRALGHILPLSMSYIMCKKDGILGSNAYLSLLDFVRLPH